MTFKPFRMSVGLCIVGAGWAARAHLNGYLSLGEKAQIQAIVVHSEKSRRRAGEWKIPKVYDSLEEALTDDTIEAFDICTPNYLHGRQALECLRAGKHVLVEKPVCVTREECRQLRVEIDRHPELKSMGGQLCRYISTYREAKNHVEAGTLGRVFYAESNYEHKIDPREYPDIMEWARHPLYAGHAWANHNVDLLRWVMGDVDEVSGYLIDELCAAFLKFKNGGLGKVLESVAFNRPYNLPLKVYGEKGTVCCRHEAGELIGVLHNSMKWEPISLQSSPVHGQQSPEWMDEMRDFVESILNVRKPVCSLLDAVKTVETSLAIESAITMGTRVKVRE